MRIENFGQSNLAISWRENGQEVFSLCDVSASYVDDTVLLAYDVDVFEMSATEGAKRLVTHLLSERDRKIIEEKKQAVLKAKKRLACEACNFDFSVTYPGIGEEFCEVHHKNEIATGGVRETNLDCLAILCSNCHRMIHHTCPMLTVEEFAKRYFNKP
jgi:5-methylcytosine-specific restriction protein A